MSFWLLQKSDRSWRMRVDNYILCQVVVSIAAAMPGAISLLEKSNMVSDKLQAITDWGITDWGITDWGIFCTLIENRSEAVHIQDNNIGFLFCIRAILTFLPSLIVHFKEIQISGPQTMTHHLFLQHMGLKNSFLHILIYNLQFKTTISF